MDDFVNLVEFRGTGLDRIELDLNKVGTAATQATAAGKGLGKSIQDVTRAMPSMESIFRASTSTLSNRSRATAELTRQQNALSRSMEGMARFSRSYQNSFAFNLAGLGPGNPRYGQGLNWNRSLGMSGGYSRNPAATGRSFRESVAGLGPAMGAAGTGASLAGVGALGLGLSGLSGTVPMARFQSQLSRFSWELGNTLTPAVDKATSVIASAANWLSRRTRSEQDIIGYGVLAGGAAGGARFLGVPLGGIGRGIGSAGLAGARGLGALTGTGRMGTSAPGMPGSPGLPETLALPEAGRGGGMSGIGKLLGRLGLAAGIANLGMSVYDEVRGTSTTRARRGTATDSDLAPVKAEYDQKFAGMGQNEREGRLLLERSRLQTEHAQAVREYAKSPVDPVEGSLDRLTKVRQRQQYVNQEIERAGLGAKPANDHRANAIVGGEFREVGAGYYEAASAFAKTGFGKKEGQEYADQSSQLEKDVSAIAAVAREFGKGKPPPLDNGNRANLNHAIPAL